MYHFVAFHTTGPDGSGPMTYSSNSTVNYAEAERHMATAVATLASMGITPSGGDKSGERTYTDPQGVERSVQIIDCNYPNYCEACVEAARH